MKYKAILVIYLFTLLSSCNRYVYRTSRSKIDWSTHQVRYLADHSLFFDFDSNIDDNQFIYPLSSDTVGLSKIEIPRIHYRSIISDIGLTKQDSIIYINPFSIGYITNHIRKPNNIIDYTHCDAQNLPKIYRYEYESLFEHTFPKWIVYQSIRLNNRKKRIVFQHYIPYGNKWISICYILQCVTSENRNIVPRLYSANYNITAPENIPYILEYIEKYINDTRLIIRRLNQ